MKKDAWKIGMFLALACPPAVLAGSSDKGTVQSVPDADSFSEQLGSVAAEAKKASKNCRRLFGVLEEAELIQDILKGYFEPKDPQEWISYLKGDATPILVNISPDREPALDQLLARPNFSNLLHKESVSGQLRVRADPRPKIDVCHERQFAFLSWKLYQRLEKIIDNTQDHPDCAKAKAMAVWACETHVNRYPSDYPVLDLRRVFYPDWCHRLLQ